MSKTENRTVDLGVEHWLRNEVALVYDAVTSGQSETSPVSEVFDEIRARHAANKNASSVLHMRKY